MSIGRVTQRMLTEGSLDNLQRGLGRLAKVQEQLSTGRVINRPSDNPTGTTSSMRLRSSLADQAQYSRNAQDGLGWLTQVDSALDSVTTTVKRARDLALQGANAGLLLPGVVVKVDVDGPSVFGDGATSVFAELDALATALRAGNQAGISAGINTLNARVDTVTSARTAAGTRFQRLEQADQIASDAGISLQNQLSTIENADLAETTVELKLQEVAYQAALGATSRVMQPSLLDFLR